MGSKVKDGHFIGYDKESKGYCIYWEDRRAVTVKRDVYFNKRSVSAPEMTLIEEETYRNIDQPLKSVTSTENIAPPMNKDTNSQTVNASGQSVENTKNPVLNEGNPSRNRQATSLSNSPVPNTSSQTSTPDPETLQQIHHSDNEDEVESELLGWG